MKTHSILRISAVSALSGLLLGGTLLAQKPQTPADLKVDTIIGHEVTLSWTNPDQGEAVFTSGFERSNPADSNVIEFEQGWTVKTTNSSYYACTWFNYPSDDTREWDEYRTLINSGEKSAVLFPDMASESADYNMHQDEWLISPIVKDAVYLKFHHYVPSETIINGANPEYPDHYVVIVSTDGGRTWGEPIWDARYDAVPNDRFQTVTLKIADEPVENLRVAFRAYGDWVIDDGDTANRSLYGVWAIDDVEFFKAAGEQAASETVFSDDFESEGEADDENMEFGKGWTVQGTEAELDPEEEEEPEFTRTWFRSPVIEDDETFAPLVYAGQRSAMIFPDNAELYQDEWLISPEIPVQEGKKLSLTFSYLTGAAYIEEDEESGEPVFVFDETTGNYRVLMSRDGGQTWTDTLWNMSDDPTGTMKDEMFYANTVSLTLDARANDKIKIAFCASGIDEEMGLGAFWVVDDVQVTASENTSIHHYAVTLDGEELAEVRGTSWMDGSAKTAGRHTYSVRAVTSGGVASDAVSVDVELKELVFAAPVNFTCTPVKEEETGKYTVVMTWEAPEGEYKPTTYTIYNGKFVFGSELTEENGREGLGMTGCFGVYQFSIVANYKSPNGQSEPVVRNLALGVRFGVNELKAENDAKDVVLTWEAPYASEFTVDSYTVYRGGVKLAEGLKELTYRDAAVENGLYQYTVIAVYTDKEESVRATVMHQVGERQSVTLPYTQEFNTTFLPENWMSVNQTVRTPDRYMWYFDDGSRLGVEGRGFEGCYAAIDCIDAPGYTRNATLELPPIDLSAVKDPAGIVLSFFYSYGIGGACSVGTEWSVDGTEWGLVEMIDKSTGVTSDPWESGDYNVHSADHKVGAEEAVRAILDTARTLYLRVHYSSAMSNFFAFDNLTVEEGNVANQAVEEAFDFYVSRVGEMLTVHASADIQRVEVFSVQGARLADKEVRGGNMVSLSVPQAGVTLLRVTTAAGVKTKKYLL